MNPSARRLLRSAILRLSWWLALAIVSLSLEILAEEPRCLGVNDSVIWRTNEEQDVAFAKYLDSGTKYLRVGADWNAIEGQGKGIYNPRYVDRLDYFMKKASELKLKVLLIAAYAPAWANGGNQGSGWAPLRETDFADYCEWLLRHCFAYKDSDGARTLEAIELWNEPDLSDLFFKPFKRCSADGAALYGKMVVAAGERIKAVRKEINSENVLILAPCVSDTHSPAWHPWMDSFYAVRGVTSCYDVFSWHSYWENSGTTGWLPPELPPCFSSTLQQRTVLGKLTADNGLIRKKMIAAGDGSKPNWCTEIGASAKSGEADHRHGFLSFSEQKAHFEDSLSTLYSGKVSGMSRIYWFSMFDNPSAKGSQQFYGLLAWNASVPIDYANSSKCLSSAALTPKPAYEAYVNAMKSSPRR